jgi:hypothetical protein
LPSGGRFHRELTGLCRLLLLITVEARANPGACVRRRRHCAWGSSLPPSACEDPTLAGLREGVRSPDIYDPTLYLLYSALLAYFGAVALP